MWEFGPAVEVAGHRLVITAESAHELRPLVRTILARAPSLEGWEFYEYRLAEGLELARRTVEGRTGLDVKDFTFRATLGDRRLVDLTFSSPAIVDPRDSTALGAAFIVTEALLGENFLNTWIGEISLSASSGGDEKKGRFIGLDRLNETAGALANSLRDQLPAKPHCDWIDDAQWSMWQIEPERADDYPAQMDLSIGKSVNPALWFGAHRGGYFSSERYSRCGETFCYLKLDRSHGLPEGGFREKSEIEDALDAVLRPQGLGSHIGGGMGLRYAYIDLAFSDVDQGIRAAIRRLREGGVPKRSWILFFDSDLAAEWVGVYEDTPPPPLALGSQQ
jgi:hypothetical protein